MRHPSCIAISVPCLLILPWLGLLAACSDPDSCSSHADTYCSQGALYWVDACGTPEELSEYCPCGCDPDARACASCECDCSHVGPCCDGCRAIGEGQACEDGDPDTTNDLCSSGECAGWSPAGIASPAAPATPLAPSDPAPPGLQSWTCPLGWQAIQHESILDESGDPFAWCQPPPLPRLRSGDSTTPLKEGESEGDRPICDPGSEDAPTFPLVGHASCQPLGDPCTGLWPDIPSEVPGNRIYVLAGAAGGDGTQASPFGTLAAAVTAAAAGDVLVLAAGTYPESVSISGELTLWGACVRDTIIEAPGPHAGAASGAIAVTSEAEVTLRSLRISGAQIGVYLGAEGAKVSLQGVWIQKATRHGVLVNKGEAQLEKVLLDSTQLNDEGSLGRGITVSEDSRAQVLNSTLERNQDLGIYARGAGTEVHLEDTSIRNTRSLQPDEVNGSGLFATDGAVVNAARVLLDANRDAGLAAIGAGVEVSIEDLVITDTLHREATDEYGMGLAIADQARVTLRRGLLARNLTQAVLVTGDSTLEAEDFVVQDTREEPDSQEHGHGLAVANGGSLTVNRGLVENSHSTGILAVGSGTQVVLYDTLVRETQSRELDQDFGRGLEANGGASLSCTRLALQGNREFGMMLSDAQTRADLQDLTIQDTRPCESDGGSGLGASIEEGAQLTLARGRFERNRSIGIYVGDPDTFCQFEDITVRETMSTDTQPPVGGPGMVIGGGAHASLTRGWFEGNRTLGLQVHSAGTTAELQDITIIDTLSSDEDLDYGRGLEVISAAAVTLERGWIQGNREAGISVGLSGSLLEMTDVTVTDTLPSEANGEQGHGMTVAYGARVTLSRGHFEKNRTLGVVMDGEGTQATLEDLTILDTLSKQYNRQLGVGLQASSGATVDCSACLLAGNREHGIVAVHRGTDLVLNDVTVRNTRSQENNLSGGSGLVAGLGARVQVSGGLFASNHEVGVGALDAGTEITLQHVVIRDTLPRECALPPQATCVDIGFGVGLGAYHQASILLSGVVLADSHLAGVQLALEGTLSGRGLSMRGNPIGVNIQDPAQDYVFFQEVSGLWMEDNQVNFGSVDLPVPDPLGWME